MRKIKVTCSIGFAGCNDEEIVEVDDSMTVKDIDEMVHEMAMEHANSWEGDERLGEWDEEFTEMFFENAHSWWEDAEEDD